MAHHEERTPPWEGALLIVGALALAPLGLFHDSVATIALLFALPFVLGFLTNVGFAKLVGAARSPKRSSGIFRLALWLGTFVCVAWLVGFWIRVELAERQLQPLVDAVEAYHAREGEYPRLPDQLPANVWEPLEVGEIRDGPRGSTLVPFRSDWTGRHGLCRLSPTDYDLMFTTFLFTKRSYDRRTGSWNSWD